MTWLLLGLALAAPPDPYEWAAAQGDPELLEEGCLPWVEARDLGALQARLQERIGDRPAGNAARWELVNLLYMEACAAVARRAETRPPPVASPVLTEAFLQRRPGWRPESALPLIRAIVEDERERPRHRRSADYAAGIQVLAASLPDAAAQPLLEELQREGTSEEAGLAHLWQAMRSWPDPSIQRVRQAVPHLEAAMASPLPSRERALALALLASSKHRLGADPREVLAQARALLGSDSELLPVSVIAEALTATARAEGRPLEDVAAEWLAPATAHERESVLHVLGEASAPAPNPPDAASRGP